MNAAFPVVVALVAGFAHAFEADHLVAVSNIVTRRTTARAAIKDGVFWGLGHTSTILLVALVFLLGRLVLHLGTFRYLEASVGLMLVGLGGGRLWKMRHLRIAGHAHAEPAFSLAYGVGMVHGLAGSGALLLSVLTQIKSSWDGIRYLLIFGAGSVAGMMVAAGIFSLPFSVAILQSSGLRTALSVVSSVLCVGLGLKVLYQNLTV
ncbi:urease accessory protein [Hymenobacter terricola]|uniref:urease accessory protein n=1 Tax=Hymenobacter terricola TaxID=2819236 RepID=UPI001B30F9E1|nr:urease accessory protein [Hymenobacter terricola]